MTNSQGLRQRPAEGNHEQQHQEHDLESLLTHHVKMDDGSGGLHHRHHHQGRHRFVDAQKGNKAIEEDKEHASHGVYRGNRALAYLRALIIAVFSLSGSDRYLKRVNDFERLRRRRPLFFVCSFFIAIILVVTTAVVPASSREHVLRSLSIQTTPQLNHPIPPPPHDSRVSVVIMNHNRPRMLKQSTLIETLANHPNIAEILLCHSNPQTMFHHMHPKVRNINAIQANRDYGLSLRFRFAATHARSPWIIHVDDDQELTPHAIDLLLGEFSLNTRRIVGRYGRKYVKNFWNRERHGYNTRNIIGQVEVVLTKLLIMEQRICHFFAKYQYIVAESMLNESKPLWNGEDIFMNLVANHVYGMDENQTKFHQGFNNLAMPLDVWEASDDLKDDDSGEHDVSGNMDRHRPWNVGWVAYWEAYHKAKLHTAYRGRLWEYSKQQLSLLPSPYSLDPWSPPPTVAEEMDRGS